MDEVNKIIDDFQSSVNDNKRVIDKLLQTSNASVFDKVCRNLEIAYRKIEVLNARDVVKMGLGRRLIDVLTNFRNELLRLAQYKDYLMTYIGATERLQSNVQKEMTKEEKVKSLVYNNNNNNIANAA